MVALANLDPQWIVKLYKGSEGGGTMGINAPIAKFTIYDTDTLEGEVHKVKFTDSTLADNDSAERIVWYVHVLHIPDDRNDTRWPAALQQALKQNGSPGVEDGKFKGGSPAWALEHLTGHKATWVSGTDDACECTAFGFRSDFSRQVRRQCHKVTDDDWD